MSIRNQAQLGGDGEVEEPEEINVENPSASWRHSKAW